MNFTILVWLQKNLWNDNKLLKESGNNSDESTYYYVGLNDVNEEGNGMVYGYFDDERVEWGKLVDGKQEGIWKFFHPNGQVMSEMFFEDGDMKEVMGRWNEDGSVKE